MTQAADSEFNLALEGRDFELGSALRSFLTDAAAASELGTRQDDFATPLARQQDVPLAPGGVLEQWRPSPFPAERQEFTAENNCQQPPSVTQAAVGSTRLDTSSSGGTRAEAATAACSQRERNRAAQKKFRDRQKARAADSNRRLEELERRMRELMRERDALEARNRVLQHTVMLSATHMSDLETQQEAFQIQQEVILMDTARIYRRGLNRPDLTLEDTKEFTMAAFLNVFEHFIGRYRTLLEGGCAGNPASAAYKELHELVCARRLEEGRIALFSKWSSATLAWNREETTGLQPPSKAFYAQLLASLHLSAVQQREWLLARRQLLERMAGVRRQRQKAALSLGLLLLQQQAVDGLAAEERRMRESLEEEREAVLEFLYTVIDCHTQPVQEALLDATCHPWWPCLWTLCGVLAERQKGEPPDTLLDDDGRNTLFSRFSAAELLREPLLARMGGLQLKRTIVSVPTPENVIAAAATPPPKIADMRNLTVFEVMLGKHLKSNSADVQRAAPSHGAAPTAAARQA